MNISEAALTVIRNYAPEVLTRAKSDLEECSELPGWEHILRGTNLASDRELFEVMDDELQFLINQDVEYNGFNIIINGYVTSIYF